MLAIKFSRVGKKGQPSFRVVVTEKSRDPWGKNVEIVGHIDRRAKKQSLNAERIAYWISKGAQPTDSVWNMLVDAKIVEGKKHSITTLSKKRREKIAAKTVSPAETPVQGNPV